MNTLVIFSGLPGVGKSTLAHRLAQELRWPLLSIDDVTGPIPENAGISFWDSRVAVLLRLTEVQLELGLSVIVDSVFMNLDRNHAQELARKYNVHFRPIYVYLSDDEIWKQRVRERYAEMQNPEVATWERIQHQRERFRPWQPGAALFIDSLRSVDRNYESVLNFVMAEDVMLEPLSDVPLVEGKYHA